MTTFQPTAVAADDDTANAATLWLNITNVDPDKGGYLDVLLYDRRGWLHAEKAIRHIELPIGEHRAFKLSMKALAYPGIYAIEVFQDANSNHTLDMRWLPFPGPTEAYGFPNNYVPFSKPSFEKASFRLDQKEVSIQIQLHD